MIRSGLQNGYMLTLYPGNWAENKHTRFRNSLNRVSNQHLMDIFNFRAVVLMFSCFGSLTELLSAVQSHLEQSYRHQQHNHLHDEEVGRESDGDEEIEDDLWDRQR